MNLRAEMSAPVLRLAVAPDPKHYRVRYQESKSGGRIADGWWVFDTENESAAFGPFELSTALEIATQANKERKP